MYCLPFIVKTKLKERYLWIDIIYVDLSLRIIRMQVDIRTAITNTSTLRKLLEAACEKV